MSAAHARLDPRTPLPWRRSPREWPGTLPGSCVTSTGSLRDGNDPAVRPQDDLFGHVNGRWYDTVEIPADLPGYGAFMELRLNAEKQVGDLLREAAAEAVSGLARPGSTTEQLGDFFES